MNDDDLDRMLRAADPATVPLRSDLTLRQATILQNIVARPPRAATTARRRLVLAITAPVAAAIAALTVVAMSVLNIFGGPPAAAWGPPPLSYQATTASLEEVVAMATSRLRGQTEPVTAERAATMTAWNLALDDAGTPEQVVAIAPTVTELIWAPDLSGSMITRAGTPYRADGDDPIPQDESVRPGAILDERFFAPGEYPPATPDADELDLAGFRALFDLGAPDRATPGDALYLVESLLNEWTLTGDQHADILEVLSEYDGLRLLGTTTDRLGREVYGIDAPSARGRTATLLVSAETGRIVGVERSVVADGDPLGVPAGTVISYTLWEGLG